MHQVGVKAARLDCKRSQPRAHGEGLGCVGVLRRMGIEERTNDAVLLPGVRWNALADDLFVVNTRWAVADLFPIPDLNPARGSNEAERHQIGNLRQDLRERTRPIDVLEDLASASFQQRFSLN